MAACRILSLIFLLLTVCLVHCIAQQSLYNYLQFTTQDGLPSNLIRDAKQDKEGLLWITTKKGLAYFDGTHFFPVDFNIGRTSFSNDLGQLSLSADECKIWIATYNQGLLCYDRTKPLEAAVKNYGVKVTDSRTELEKHELYAVHVASSGLVYFGGQETDLQIMDPETEVIRILKLGKKAGHETIFRIEEDKHGILWISTRYGGVYSHNPTTQESIAYNLENKGENGAAGICFVEDDVFVSYYDYDIIKINPKRKEIVAKSLLDLGMNKQMYANFIDDIVYLPEEQSLLAAHIQDGIYDYHLPTGKRHLIRWEDMLPKNPVPTRINTIYTVSDGYFLCTNNGLLYYSKQLNRLQEYIPVEKDPIERIFKVGATFWYASQNAIGKLSADFKQRLSEVPLQGLHVSQYHAIGTSIYLSTYDKGVYVCETDKARITALNVDGPSFGIEKADCNTVLADTVNGEPVLWIGSWNSGLYRYNVLTKRITLFNRKQGLADHKVITLGKDKDNMIWIGTDGYGVMKVADKINGRFEHFVHSASPFSIASNTIFAFLSDATGRFWYSSGHQGIGWMEEQSNQMVFQQIRDNNRFPWAYAHALQQDKKGRIWMATTEGVMLFHPQQETFYQLYAGDGIFPPEQFKTSRFYFDEDYLVWTTDKGLVKGRIDKVGYDDISLFLPTISTFKVLNKDHSYRLWQHAIQLAPYENTFSFTFSVPQLIKNNRLRYAYRLEGVDSDWVIADSYQQAIYTNVAGGNYTFHLKVGDLDGNWSEKILSIPVYVKTNWYQTFWFKSMAMTLLFLAIVFFLSYRIRQQKHINQLQKEFTTILQQELITNEKKIKEQAETLELERQEKLESEFKQKLYESELKAIRSQMNPHFIFNVLNSIEAYVVEQDADSASKLIHKFSALSRIVLENSQFALVSIASEVRLVQLYLELEQERFANNFAYTVEVGEGQDVMNKKIPSMLIQPIVENAVHHGVRHLIGKLGKIKIVVAETNNQIRIEVWDNGVGFDNAKKESSPSFKNISFGLKGVRDRIAMINNGLSSIEAQLYLESLQEHSYFSTKVTIVLPSGDNNC